MPSLYQPFRAALSLCLIISAAACSTSDQGNGRLQSDSEQGCHPLSIETCTLPYPSSEWSIEDSSSATGIRLQVPDSLIDQQLIGQLPDRITLQTIFDGSTGYSAASSVLFELPNEIDESSLPEDGGLAVIAVDLTDNELAPVNAVVSAFSKSDKVASRSHLVEIYPRGRWKFGHHYAVFLSDSLMPRFGREFSAADNMNHAAQRYLQDKKLGSALDLAGITPQSLLSLTDFVVRTEQEVTAPLKRMTKVVYQKDHPIRNVKVVYLGSATPIAAEVSGQLKVHSFRGNDGGINFEQNNGVEQWIPFLLHLPQAAKDGQVPVVIYGHGLTVAKETSLIVSLDNANRGMATVSIDHPNHGFRAEGDGGNLLLNLSPDELQYQMGMLYQSSVDFMSLLKAVKTSIGEIDVLPRTRGFLPVADYTGKSGDGVADLDLNNISYQGTSLGGVLGSAFVALAPELKGAFLQVSGVGIIHILSDSFFWNLLFYQLIPEGASGAEAVLLRAAVQHHMDYGDAINFVHYFRNPPEGIEAKPVGLVVGAHDGVVTNPSSIALAEIAELPMVGQALFNMPGNPSQDDYDQGYGVTHVPSPTDIRFLTSLAAHGSFMTDAARADMDAWVRRYILEQAP